MHSIFLVLTVIQGFISQGIGIYAILRGNYKPQRMTRFIYLLLSIVILATLYAQGSVEALYLASMQTIGIVVIFILSFKYGMGGGSKLDIITLIGFVLSLYVWKTTSNPTLALYLGILTDVIGFVPTLSKIWRLPHTEDWRFYFSDTLAGFFSLLSIPTFTLPNIIFSLYVFLLNFVAVILIRLRGTFVGQRFLAKQRAKA